MAVARYVADASHVAKDMAKSPPAAVPRVSESTPAEVRVRYLETQKPGSAGWGS